MAEASLFRISGNIKQQFNPFVLNPNASIHTFSKDGQAPTSTDFKCAAPQFFTYRQSSAFTENGGRGKLNFFPSSMSTLHLNDDISMKLLYARNNQTGKIDKKSLTIQDVINCIPGVQIREYLPDTRLDQCINFFTGAFAGVTSMFSEKKEEKGSSGSGGGMLDKLKTLAKKIGNVTKYAGKYLIGMTDPSFYDDADSLFNQEDMKFHNYSGNMTDRRVATFVLKFVYMLYYRLQSCVTTNIYEVPALLESKNIITSEGQSGWGGEAFRVSEFFKDPTGLIGKLINSIGMSNVGINYTPWWNAKDGSKTQEPEVEIKFDLFNDSLDASLINFIFVNTIVPNNRWIQYNMFQHSSDLYDVKIEGINRLFACAGNFTVTGDGVFREPSYKFIEKITSKFLNKAMNSGTFKTNIITRKLIKIPDVYHVSLHFKSCLPANFNTYLFNYAENKNHMETHATHAYDNNEITQMFEVPITTMSNRIKAAWEAGGKEYKDCEAAASSVSKASTSQG